MKSRKSNHYTFPHPASAEEIRRAREAVIKVTGTEIKSLEEFKSLISDTMWQWEELNGKDWRDYEVYFGILIGLQIAKARRDREEKVKHGIEQAQDAGQDSP